MSRLQGLASEKIWFDKCRYDKAEKQFYENIQQEQNRAPSHGGDQGLMSHIEPDNLEAIHSVVEEIATAMQKPESTAAMLDQSIASMGNPPAVDAPVQVAPAKELRVKNDDNDNDDNDNDIDLFCCDEDDKETAKIKQERLDACDTTKAKEPISIAKSSIILDIKPWDDETNMVMLEDYVRSLQIDGLLWGASRLVPVGFGIKKLQISCVVEDEKVGTDILEEKITKFEDYVQSVDIAAFNKI